MPESIGRPMFFNPGHKRSAITLIEVIGTLSVLLVLGVSAASILGAITDIGSRNNRARLGRASVERLANVFRLDVHAADQVAITDDQWPIELTILDTSIRYDWDEPSKSIRRTASGGNEQLAIDQFPLSQHCDPRVQANDEMVTVVLKDGGKIQPWIIEATRP